MNELADRDLVRVCERSVSRWRRLYGVLLAAHFTFGLLAIASPALVAANLVGESGSITNRITAVVATLAAAIVTFLRPDRYAHGFLAAYKVLEIAIERYRFSETAGRNADMLLTALETASSLVISVQPAVVSQGEKEGIGSRGPKI